MTPRDLFFALFAVMGLTTSVQATTITLTEADFDVGSYTIAATSGGAGGQTVSSTTSGNPDGALSVLTNFHSAVSTITLFTDMVVDLSQGSILSLDWQVDFNPLNAYGQGQGFGLVVAQNGQYFQITDVTWTVGGWHTKVLTGLTAANFGGTLDLSQGAGPVQFGLVTGNSSGSGIHVLYDNFQLTLETTLPAVPIPAGLPLMAGALGLFGIMARRR